jgi:hypothetical protein
MHRMHRMHRMRGGRCTVDVQNLPETRGFWESAFRNPQSAMVRAKPTPRRCYFAATAVGAASQTTRKPTLKTRW